MSALQVGDVCEILGPLRADPISLAAYAGMECTIESGPHCSPDFVSHQCYEVLAYDGKRMWVDRMNLRKKDPPGDPRQLVRWADCPWQPKQLTVP